MTMKQQKNTLGNIVAICSTFYEYITAWIATCSTAVGRQCQIYYSLILSYILKIVPKFVLKFRNVTSSQVLHGLSSFLQTSHLT